MTHANLWKQIKDRLKNSQPQHAFSTWFEPIVSIALNNNALVLEVPNQFFFEWLQSHYKETIEKEALFVFSEPLTIKYTVSPESTGTSASGEKNNSTQETRAAKKRISTINEKYTFSNFIEGAHNEFAKAAALSVSKSLGQQAFNPLVIYGGVGMGKTHLLHAIGNKVMSDRRQKHIVCASSEKFTLDFISSIQKIQQIFYTLVRV